ncbi:hypothetical protein [Mucilaginibacter ginsenosidivorans]|nr:hypothetical protein [Mucilaginibacter ginsenosidivorans]
MAECLTVPLQTLIYGEGFEVDELAPAEPLAIGAHVIKRARVKSGEFVLIIGAGQIGLGTMDSPYCRGYSDCVRR